MLGCMIFWLPLELYFCFWIIAWSCSQQLFDFLELGYFYFLPEYNIWRGSIMCEFGESLWGWSRTWLTIKCLSCVCDRIVTFVHFKAITSDHIWIIMSNHNILSILTNTTCHSCTSNSCMVTCRCVHWAFEPIIISYNPPFSPFRNDFVLTLHI